MSQTSLKQKKNELGMRSSKESLEAEKRKESDKTGVRLSNQGSQESSMRKTDSRGYLVRSQWSRTSRSPSTKAPSIDEPRSRNISAKVELPSSPRSSHPRRPSRPGRWTRGLPRPQSPILAPGAAPKCKRIRRPGPKASCGKPARPATHSRGNIRARPPPSGSPPASAGGSTPPPPSWTATLCPSSSSGRTRTTTRLPTGHP
ncbi:NT5C1B isoform 2 [Pongo abelii]|uniref:NT5C1B isoform 2 n=1 Tax=Pongo abelii TaxID=9601 RepID=A0A2J8RSN2_PONAB|nr:NT5C1B isoform 2 [Pongo abelii]